ncbi:MAG TPA: DUF4097 family beta strand repeat-containing protein [Candidatus Methylomirabilis sp.]|nr:DUF4097 family beta strand repeat-containing protein [Candidatus Methylomirabilis sp.]
MKSRYRLPGTLALLLLTLAFAGCEIGPTVSGSFDRSLDVSGPIRLELTNVAGNISIVGSADGKVHVHGDVRVGGFGFGSPEERLKEILASPPVELKGDTLRVGRDMSRFHNVSIAYQVEIPQSSTVTSASVSGSQSIQDIHGTVQLASVSGSLTAQNVGNDSRLSSTSGSVEVDKCGDNVRVTSVSGSVTVSGAKGDVLAHSVSGDVTVNNPGGRVDANTSSGSVEVRGGNADVKAHSASGSVTIHGNPSGNSYWDLKTVSGTVDIAVPPASNFHFSANAVSGQIRTQIPIVIEEEGKHSLRAHLGDGGGRVEVHTVSGGIEVQGSGA